MTPDPLAFAREYQSDRRFRHLKSGGTYRLVCCANLEADCSPLAVYKSEQEDGEVWVRPYAEFFDGRFEEIEPIAAPPVAQQLSDEQIYEALVPIADEEIMARNKRSIIQAGRDLIRLASASDAGGKDE